MINRLAHPYLYRASAHPEFGLRAEDNTATLKDDINLRYDRMMFEGIVEEYYDHSGFHNFGYWTSGTTNQREASENLVDALLEMMPRKSGRILDVACGLGATTERLLRHYPPGNISGINISEKQLAASRRRVPGVRFHSMDATELEFPDNSFENILCVEAVFHFDTREDFLGEALRVLKPGGCLALSDIFLRTREAASMVKRIPLANHVPDVASYTEMYTRCGFMPVKVVEARAECWEGFRDNCVRFLWPKASAGVIPWSTLNRVIKGLRIQDWMFSNYLLVWAFKPHTY